MTKARKRIFWKHIEGTEDLLVNNFGEVKSEGGFVYKPILATRTGYLKVGIVVNGVRKQVSIHRLVAEAFVDNPYSKTEVNHKNGDKTNNCQWNLEWVTPYENQMHRRFVLGKDNSGDRNPMYGRATWNEGNCPLSKMRGEYNHNFKDSVVALDKDGNVIGRFKTQMEASIKMFNRRNASCNISKCCNHRKKDGTFMGIYFIYEKEYEKLKQADLKPRELLEHPELWVQTYRGQSAAKPKNNKY